jgi:hypothetical protein
MFRVWRLEGDFHKSGEVVKDNELATRTAWPSVTCGSGSRSRPPPRGATWTSSRREFSKTTQTVWKRSGEWHLTVSDPRERLPFPGAA